MHSSTPRRGTILFLHGNAENISTHFATIAWLTQYGYDCYIFDYRGYGMSEGIPEINGIIRDVNAMISYVESHTANQDQFIVMGQSLGGAFAINALAHSKSKQRISAVITIGAFSDYRQITRDVLSGSWLTWILQWPVSLMINNSYSPLKSVSSVSPVPLLIMHSRNDRTIGYDHALSLYDSAKQPKRLIEIKGDHNQSFEFEANRKALLDYLGKLSQ